MALALIGAAAGCSGGSEADGNRIAVPAAQAAMNEADLAADAAVAGDAAAAEAADAAAGGVNAGAEPNLQ
jgi:hypothetical protein